MIINENGFSLIELMIVVIGIFATSLVLTKEPLTRIIPTMMVQTK